MAVRASLRTPRLLLTPLVVDGDRETATALAAEDLYTFIGGRPPSTTSGRPAKTLRATRSTLRGPAGSGTESVCPLAQWGRMGRLSRQGRREEKG